LQLDKRNSVEIRRSVAKQTAVSCLLLFVHIIIFFTSAGHIDVPRAWAFFGITFVHSIVSIAVVHKLNPELIEQRLKVRRKGSKLWDEVLMRVINLTAICVAPAVAGFDVGRFHWAQLSIYYVAVGVVLYILSSALMNWAMVVNPYFEQTVRIQEERGHKMITTGPYKIVRHPGYLAGVLWILTVPLIIGSVLAFVPAGIYVLLTIIRTSLEDRTLNRELSGYSEYAKKVKYRLFPGIW